MPQIILNVTKKQLAEVKQTVEEYDESVQVLDPLELLKRFLQQEIDNVDRYIGSACMDEGGNSLGDCFEDFSDNKRWKGVAKQRSQSIDTV